MLNHIKYFLYWNLNGQCQNKEEKKKYSEKTVRDGTLPYDYISRSYTGLAGRTMRSYGHRARIWKEFGTDYSRLEEDRCDWYNGCIQCDNACIRCNMANIKSDNAMQKIWWSRFCGLLLYFLCLGRLFMWVLCGGPHNLIGERTGGNKTFLSPIKMDFYHQGSWIWSIATFFTEIRMYPL